jgi:hypothetical protein
LRETLAVPETLFANGFDGRRNTDPLEGKLFWREENTAAENRQSKNSAVDTNAAPRKFLLVGLQIIRVARIGSGGALRFAERMIRFESHLDGLKNWTVDTDF